MPNFLLPLTRFGIDSQYCNALFSKKFSPFLRAFGSAKSPLFNSTICGFDQRVQGLTGFRTEREYAHLITR